MMRSYFGFYDKEFYGTLRRLGLPLMLQQALSASLHLVDNIMVGSLGDTALAALALANQITFLLTVFMFGVTSASTAFTSQFWGGGDRGSIRKTFGLALMGTQAIGWAFFLVSFIFPAGVISLFTSDADTVALGASYLRTACCAYPLMAGSVAYYASLRGTENVRLPIIASIIAIIFNTAGNYLLIFGHLGFPKLGVRGAGIATALAAALELLIVSSCARISKKPTSDPRFPVFPIKKEFIARFFKVAAPVFFNESLYSLAQVATMFVYARMGTQMTAGMGIFSVFERIAYIVFIALANSAGIMVGKRIGMGEYDSARAYSRRFTRLGAWGAAAAAVLLNAALPAVLSAYAASESAKAIARGAMLAFGAGLPLIVYNYIMVVGVMRSSGDTLFAFVVDAGCQWVFTVGLIAFAAFALGVPPAWVYAFALPGELVKTLAIRKRFSGTKWLHDLTVSC